MECRSRRVTETEDDPSEEHAIADSLESAKLQQSLNDPAGKRITKFNLVGRRNFSSLPRVSRDANRMRAGAREIGGQKLI